MKKKEIVKYDNSLNDIRLSNMNTIELNVFMAIVAQIRDCGTSKVTLSFSEIRALTEGARHSTLKEYSRQLDMLNEKLLSIRWRSRSETSSSYGTLFTTFTQDLANDALIVSVNEDFLFFFNNLVANFTFFDLRTFTSLNSKYSKNLYRVLMQYKTTGRLYIQSEKLRLLLDVPETYDNGVFVSKCLQTAIKEFEERQIFEKIEYTVCKENSKGNRISGFEFEFEYKGKKEKTIAIEMKGEK